MVVHISMNIVQYRKLWNFNLLWIDYGKQYGKIPKTILIYQKLLYYGKNLLYYTENYGTIYSKL